MSGSARTSEALAGGVLGAVLLFAGVTVPPVGGLIAIVSPLPLVLARLRSGPLTGWLAAVLATAVVAGVFGPGRAVGFALLIVPAMVMGEVMARGRGLVRSGLWALALATVQLLVLLVLTGPDLSREVLGQIEQARSAQALDALRGRGWSSEDVDQWIDSLSRVQAALAIVYPAVLVIAGAIVVLVNVLLLRAWLARRAPDLLETGQLERLRWPIGMSAAFVVSGLATLMPPLRPVGLNLLLLVGFLFLLQGFSVFAFTVDRLPGPRLLRLVLTLLLLFSPWAMAILALLGLFDTWFDFRRFSAPAEQS